MSHNAGEIFMEYAPATRTRWQRAVILAVPACYGFLGVVHPTENPGLGDPTNLWIGLHLVQLVLIGAMGWVFWMLVDGLQSRAATLVRALILPYVVLYTAMDAILGIAWGLVAREAGQLPPGDQSAAGRLLDDLIADDPTIAGLALYFGAGLAFFAVVAATVAALDTAPPTARWLLAAGGLLFAVGHVRPIGPVAATLITVAFAIATRAPRSGRRRDVDVASGAGHAIAPPAGC